MVHQLCLQMLNQIFFARNKEYDSTLVKANALLELIQQLFVGEIGNYSFIGAGSVVTSDVKIIL